MEQKVANTFHATGFVQYLFRETVHYSPNLLWVRFIWPPDEDIYGYRFLESISKIHCGTVVGKRYFFLTIKRDINEVQRNA